MDGSKEQHGDRQAVMSVEVTPKTWREAFDLTAGIEHGQLFVRSATPPPSGARVAVTIALPDGATLAIAGDVRRRVSVHDASAGGVIAGFAIRVRVEKRSDLLLLQEMARVNADLETGEVHPGRQTMAALLLDVRGTTKLTSAFLEPREPDPPAPAPKSDKDKMRRLPTADVPTVTPGRPSATSSSSWPRVAQADPAHVEADVGAIIEVEDPEQPGARSSPLLSSADLPEGAEHPLVFGIDFGTTYTSASLMTDGKARVYADRDGSTIFPSAVCYVRGRPPLVGWEALEQLPRHPTTTFVAPKRLIGRTFDDPEIDSFIATSPVPFEAGPQDSIVADVHGQLISITQVCAEIIHHAAQVAANATQQTVQHVVLAAPIGFASERRAIRRAATLVGVSVVATIDEPIAALLAAGAPKRDERVAVYDFGGGTFDFCLLERIGERFHVLGKVGDAWLGGDDFDLALASYAADQFWHAHNIDLSARAVEWQRLLRSCEAAKRKLTRHSRVAIRIRGIANSPIGPIDLEQTFDRMLFAELCGELVERSIDSMEACFAAAALEPHSVDRVVLTGGVSRIPLVQERLAEFFGRQIRITVDPLHAVALGTAIYGAGISRVAQAPRSPTT